MKARRLLARILFVAAAAVTIGGGVLVYGVNQKLNSIDGELETLAATRNEVRKKLVENKIAARTFSKSIGQIPDSTRMEQSGMLAKTLSNYQKEGVVLTNEEHELGLSIGDVEKERAEVASVLRRNVLAAGSAALLCALAGAGLLLSARSAFHT